MSDSVTGANFDNATIVNTDLSDAIVAKSNFYNTFGGGLTKEQLYSTASYKSGNLAGIGLEWNDLSGWNFAGQNLAGANLRNATLTNTDLTEANLAGASFREAELTDIDLSHAY